MKRIVAQILIYFSPSLALVAKDVQYNLKPEIAPMPKTISKSENNEFDLETRVKTWQSVLPPKAEIKLKGSDWTQEDVVKLLKMFSAVNLCVEFSWSMKGELDPMVSAMSNLIESFLNLKEILNNNQSNDGGSDKIREQLNLFHERIELLLSYYKDCYDELLVKKEETASFTSLLGYLQEFQQATENFNNTVSRIIEQIKVLKKNNKTLSIYKNLKPIKDTLKSMQIACESLTEAIKSIATKTKNVSQIFHERSFLERQRNTQNKSIRSIR